MAVRSNYFIYKRKLNSKRIVFYYKFRKSDGSLSTGTSTGCRTKAAARAYVEDLIRTGKIFCGNTRSFATYSSMFFDANGTWVQDALVRGTPEHPAISELQIKKYQMTVRRHLIPFFEDTLLSSITPTQIKEFRLHLFNTKRLSSKTINDIISVLRIILSTAYNDGLIPYIPLRGIKPLLSNPKPRESFSIEDAKTILNSTEWKDETSRLFNFVAACTGMRLSEISAIRKENLLATHIDLKDQFLNGRLRPLKTKEARKIPICPELYAMLKNQLANYSENIEFVFDELRETQASDDLRKLLKKIMPEKRKQYGYCFHCWRHFFNSFLLAENVPPIKVAAVLGHSTGVSSMQERYTHFSPENFLEVYEAQKKLLKILTT